MAGGVAQDFNIELTALNGYIELCLSMVNPASAVHENVKVIRNAGEGDGSLTSLLLAHSR